MDASSTGASRVGGTDSTASSFMGPSRADRRAIPVSDLALAEEFYQDVLGPMLGGYYVISRYPWTTMDLRRGRQLARLLARRDGEDLVGRTLHYTRVVVGRTHLILYLTDDDVQEPPADLHRGIPRVAIAVTDEQIEDAMHRFETRGIPFEGPIAQPEACPAARSVYLKDPCGNFLELCVPRSTAGANR
jgi:catechol 2,3-dioxygenase-like lactoylglutathione lyase family enzyme